MTQCSAQEDLFTNYFGYSNLNLLDLSNSGHVKLGQQYVGSWTSSIVHHGGGAAHMIKEHWISLFPEQVQSVHGSGFHLSSNSRIFPSASSHPEGQRKAKNSEKDYIIICDSSQKERAFVTQTNNIYIPFVWKSIYNLIPLIRILDETL